MLIGVGLGALPWNLTTPLRVAVPAVLLAEVGELPAFTAWRLEMQIITVKATIGMRPFVVIQINFLPLERGSQLFFFQIGRNSVSTHQA
jgi:hypothetical protein